MEIKKLRAEFHYWLYRTQADAEMLVDSLEGDHYRLSQVQIAWEAWQASHSLIVSKLENQSA